jgi:hypothetical protein
MQDLKATVEPSASDFAERERMFREKFAEILRTGPLLPADERRAEPRVAFPAGVRLIGWLGDMKAAFEYRPVDLSPTGMRLRIWASTPVSLAVGESMDVCLPFRLNEEFLSRCELRWTEPEGDWTLCGVRSVHGAPRDYGVFFDFAAGQVGVAAHPPEQREKFDEFLRWTLEDAVFAKRALILYFRHLAPVLARLARIDRAASAALAGVGLAGIEERIERNIQTLRALEERVGTAAERSDFLAEFRRAILPENDETALRALEKSAEAARYLQSIRQAERKLAMHYNSVALLVEGFAGG